MQNGSISPVLAGASDEALLEVDRRRRGDQGLFSAESSVGDGWEVHTSASTAALGRRRITRTGRYTPLSLTTIERQQRGAVKHRGKRCRQQRRGSSAKKRRGMNSVVPLSL